MSCSFSNLFLEAQWPLRERCWGKIMQPCTGGTRIYRSQAETAISMMSCEFGCLGERSAREHGTERETSSPVEIATDHYIVSVISFWCLFQLLLRDSCEREFLFVLRILQHIRVSARVSCFAVCFASNPSERHKIFRVTEASRKIAAFASDSVCSDSAFLTDYIAHTSYRFCGAESR